MSKSETMRSQLNELWTIIRDNALADATPTKDVGARLKKFADEEVAKIAVLLDGEDTKMSVAVEGLIKSLLRLDKNAEQPVQNQFMDRLLNLIDDSIANVDPMPIVTRITGAKPAGGKRAQVSVTFTDTKGQKRSLTRHVRHVRTDGGVDIWQDKNGAILSTLRW